MTYTVVGNGLHVALNIRESEFRQADVAQWRCLCTLGMHTPAATSSCWVGVNSCSLDTDGIEHGTFKYEIENPLHSQSLSLLTGMMLKA